MTQTDLERVLALPEADRDLTGLSEALTARFAKRMPCPKPLFPQQAEALAHAELAGGLVAVLAVGSGKSLLSFLIPAATGASNPLLLLPASLIGKTRRELAEWRELYEIPPLHIMSYTKLSRDKDADGVSRALERLAPDCIILDEAQMAMNTSSGCVKKLRKYINANRPKVYVMSGSFYKSSLMDAHHLITWALGFGSPLPLRPAVCRTWADAVDDGWSEADRYSAAERAGLDALAACPGEEPRKSVERRISSTYGVVRSTENFGGELTFDFLQEAVPAECEPLIEQARKGVRPDGEEIFSAFEKWAIVQELAAGFWSRWDPAPPRGWRSARKAWKTYVGLVLEDGKYDTEEGVSRAVERGVLSDGALLLQDWRRQKARFTPKSSPVWVDKDAPVLNTAARWLAAEPRRLCWVGFTTVGKRIAELARCQVFGAGQGKGGRAAIEGFPGESCVVTISANKAGRNLQAWNENLLLCAPSKSKEWEQLVGRTHRTGQTRPVSVLVVQSTPEHTRAFEAATRNAGFVSGIQGDIPKLLAADGVVGEEKERGEEW